MVDISLASNSRICAVCERESVFGTAFRMHYNVYSCEACKCFFRRSIQLKRKYICKYSNECLVSNNLTSQFCKACRLKKCFNVGMMKHSVRPKKLQKFLIHSVSTIESTPCIGESISNPLNSLNNDSILKLPDKLCISIRNDNIVSQAKFHENTERIDLSYSDNNLPSQFEDSVTSLPKPAVNKNISTSYFNSNLIDNSEPNLFIHSNFSIRSSLSPRMFIVDASNNDKLIPQERYDVASIEEVLDSLKIRILDLFKWAKRSSEFGKLSPNDQKSLLRYTVVELVMLGFARASIHYDDVLYFNHIHKIIRPNHPNSAVACVTKLTIDKLVKPLRFLNLNKSEYRIMKEIILYNPSSTTLGDLSKVREMRGSRFQHLYLEAFQDICRFGDILSLLTPLFEVATEITEQLRLEQYVQESEATMDAFLLISLLQDAEVDD